MVDCAYDPSILVTDKQQIPRVHWPSQPSLLSELQANFGIWPHPIKSGYLIVIEEQSNSAQLDGL